jgi:nitrile hydratase
MSQDHHHSDAEGGQHAKSHMHDFEAHVRAVEEDLEYYRAKRLEPRIVFMVRRGVVSFHDLLHAGARVEAPAAPLPDAPSELEARIRRLEDALDEYVRGVALVSYADLLEGVDMVIEDTRKERGDYDDALRFKKKHHEGTLEDRVAALEGDVIEYTTVLRAFTRALIDRGIVDEAKLRRRAEATRLPSAWNGARIVARAWLDPEFKARLMTIGREAVRELDIPPGRVGKLGVVENTDGVHNVIVCTLCSCYPYDLLGDTPYWYKTDEYRKRIVREPRRTLAEMFGLEVPAPREVRVYDSTSDVRYMVLPRRPAGTEGLSETDLARLVTPDSLIGAGEPLDPASLADGRAPESGRRLFALS